MVNSEFDTTRFLRIRNGNSIVFSFVKMLRLPFVIILLANAFFALLLALRFRTLNDQFYNDKSKYLRLAVLVYVSITIIGSLIAVLCVTI